MRGRDRRPGRARRRDPALGELIRAARKAQRRDAAARAAEARRYGALLRAVVGKQLSAKAARTIHERVLELFGGTTPTPEQILAASTIDLRGTGLSGRKGRVHPAT